MFFDGHSFLHSAIVWLLFMYFCVSIFHIISYLTTSPTHTWKSTLYLPFPISFQMFFDGHSFLHSAIVWLLFMYFCVSIFHIISYLTTSPTHTWKSTLYLPFPISFQMFFDGHSFLHSAIVWLLFMYFCVSIFHIISYLTTSPTHTWKSTLYLPFPIPFQMFFDGHSFLHSAIVWLLFMYFCVSIFHIISYLTTSPTHTWKSTLYLPFPIPFQMFFDGHSFLHSAIVWLLFMYFCVSIFHIISYLTTSPTHTWKSTLYLPFPIPFQMLFPVMVRSFYVPP